MQGQIKYIIVALIAIGVVGVWYFSGSGDDSATSEDAMVEKTDETTSGDVQTDDDTAVEPRRTILSEERRQALQDREESTRDRQMFTDRDRDDRTARSDESQATAQPTEPAESAETETTKTETSMASRDEGEESSIVTPPARRSFLDTDESGVSEVRDADEPAQATDPLRAETLANAPSPAGDVTDMTEEDVSPAVGSDVVMGEGPAEEVAPLTTPNTQPAMAAAQTKPAATPQTHTLEPGDTFTALAVEYFGHAKYATRIMQANPDLDPRRLRIGTEITIPTIPEAAPSQSPATESTAVASPAPARPEPAQPSEPRVITTTGGLRVVQPSDAGPAPIPEDRAYTVQPGEGWYQLAQRFFGDSSQWTRLYELNRERVPTDPNMLQAGTVIELPQGVQATQSGG